MAVASDRVDATLEGFTRWAREVPQKLSGDPGADAEELRLLLGLLRDHVGVDDPANMGPGDLRELLLAVYPRKVTVLDAEGTADARPAPNSSPTAVMRAPAAEVRARRRSRGSSRARSGNSPTVRGSAAVNDST
jgi:hypothetical protein